MLITFPRGEALKEVSNGRRTTTALITGKTATIYSKTSKKTEETAPLPQAKSLLLLEITLTVFSHFSKMSLNARESAALETSGYSGMLNRDLLLIHVSQA